MKMQIAVDSELAEICREIMATGWSETDWAAHEAADWFQTEHYCGGYDATEGAFTFSYHGPQQEELWFQVTVPQVSAIAKGALTSLPARLPD